MTRDVSGSGLTNLYRHATVESCGGLMSSFTTERIHFEILMSEAALGLSFLRDADQVAQPDRRWRGILNGREVLRSVKERIGQGVLTEAQGVALRILLEQLEHRLSAY